MDLAMKASRIALEGKDLPDDLKPQMSQEEWDDRMDGTSKLTADYIGLKPSQAFAINQVLSDPAADPTVREQALQTLAKFPRADHEQVNMARQRLDIAFDNLDILKGEKGLEARLRGVLTNVLISATDAKGKVDYKKARQSALWFSLLGEKELLPDLSKYLDVAEKNQEMIEEGVRPIVIQFGTGGPSRLPPPTR
jgi:hypothetical protein